MKGDLVVAISIPATKKIKITMRYLSMLLQNCKIIYLFEFTTGVKSNDKNT